MKQFGLIGYPLEHSFSKRYFTDKFEKEGIDSKYELYQLSDIKEFTYIIKSIDLSGLNVTIPYKELVIPYLNELDETALGIGAVNVIKFIKNNDKILLRGYNTDVIGFTESIKEKIKPYHTKALILGTGGAAKAIAYGLKKMGLEVTCVSRNVGQRTVRSEQSREIISYNELTKQVISDNLVIVNASPIGMYPKVDEFPVIPYEFLTEKHLLFDAVYNPSETLFLKKGKEIGTDILNGEQMLIGQAEAAWKIWNSL